MCGLNKNLAETFKYIHAWSKISRILIPQEPFHPSLSCCEPCLAILTQSLSIIIERQSIIVVRAAEKIAPRARVERMSAAARWAAHPPVHQSPLAKRALTRLLARSLCALHDQAALEPSSLMCPCHTRILSVFVSISGGGE